MIYNKPDSWLRWGFALIVFWAILSFTDLILTDVAAFNANLNSVVVRQGYIPALRGIILFLVLAVVLVMTVLLRRGLIIAPLVWAAQVVRIALSGQWRDMMRNILFVSDGLNFAVMLLIPILLALLLWQSLNRLDPELSLGKLVVPGLWLVLAGLVSVGNIFVWYWSMQFGLGSWPSGYGLVLFLTGVALVAWGANRYPWASLALFFSGLLLPTAVYIPIWGGYEGLGLALLSFLPWGRGDFLQTWLAIMACTALPVLLALGINQFASWRRGEKLMEIM